MRNFVASLKGGKRRPDAVRRNTNTIKTRKGFIMVQNPQFLINIRKNINANNPGYGKYYPKAVEKETITLRGLAKHMAEHQCVYSRDIIEGVLTKMASCMIELSFPV